MNSLIYFNNCASTQDELIDFLNQHYLSEDFLAVYTFNQTKGRGQYGNFLGKLTRGKPRLFICSKNQKHKCF